MNADRFPTWHVYTLHVQVKYANVRMLNIMSRRLKSLRIHSPSGPGSAARQTQRYVFDTAGRVVNYLEHFEGVNVYLKYKKNP